jgi:enoyl-[acyl-carrier-protein] reductase (NADH)
MSRRAQEDAEILAYIGRKQPLAEDLIPAEDIARASVFLMSDEARMITGETLTVDAGWSVTP